MPPSPIPAPSLQPKITKCNLYYDKDSVGIQRLESNIFGQETSTPPPRNWASTLTVLHVTLM